MIVIYLSLGLFCLLIFNILCFQTSRLNSGNNHIKLNIYLHNNFEYYIDFFFLQNTKQFFFKLRFFFCLFENLNKIIARFSRLKKLELQQK